MKYILGTLIGIALVAAVGCWVLFNVVGNSPEGMSDIYQRAALGTDEGDAGDVFVLQYDAESAGECDAGDVFNVGEQVCEYECADAVECAQLADAAEEELAGWGDYYEVAEENKVNKHSEESASEDKLTALYTIGAREQIILATGTDDTAHRDAWEQIAGWAPDNFTAAYLERFGTFSDAEGDTLAYVHDEDGNGKWDVVINMGWYEGASARDRALTIIHELAHVVTLNSDQVRADTNEVMCTVPAFFTGEGCAARGTYIADFVRAFWSASDLAAVGGGAGENAAAAAKLHIQKPAHFTTDYAATNPGEDIAESFALFILDQQHANTETVAHKKINFFYAYPALVAFRADMRQSLVTGIVRAKRATR